MKKFTNLFLLALLLVCGSQLVRAQKVGMFIGYESVDAIQDDDEKAAAEWFQSTYGGNGGVKVYTPNNISTLNVNEVKALWVAIDRKGLAVGWKKLPAEFVSDKAIASLTKYVKEGGNLYLTNHATQLVVGIGRVSDIYAPNIFGSGEGGVNPDVWGINAQIGCNPDLPNHYDHRNHPIYKDLTVNSELYTDHGIYPLIGNGWKEDHNCKWDFNGISGLEDNPNKLADFENKTTSSVIGAWQQVTDYACAGVVEFKPEGDFKGTILCNGIAAYEFNQNDRANLYQDNIYKLTSNSLDYLKSLNTQASITAPITVDGTKSYWGTFYSSHAKTLPEGVSAYTVESAVNGYAKLKKVADAGQVIPANQGFLLNSSAEQNGLYLTTAEDAKAITVEDNLLKGSDGEQTFANEGTYYILGRTGTEGAYTYGLYWQKGTEGKSVKNAANKAFLLVVPTASEAKGFCLTFGEVTGIQKVESGAENHDDKVYNLAGQQVGKDYKGLVIKQGKKYILK